MNIPGLHVVQSFIPKSRTMNRPGYAMTPEYITVHDAGNPRAGANAAMHIKYLNENAEAGKKNVSWHFTVDESMIAQHLPINESAWHAGDGATGTGNRKSIGVEICDNIDGDRPKAEANAIKLIAALLLETGLPILRVVQHNHWSGKDCPGVIRKTLGGWSRFVARIEAELKRVAPLPQEDKPKGTGPFKDVPDNHWAIKSINKAHSAGAIQGINEGVFGLGQPVTREQLVVILDRLGLLEGGK